VLSATLMSAATLTASTSAAALMATVAAVKAGLWRTLVAISRAIGGWWWRLSRGRILILYRRWARLVPAVARIAAIGLSDGWLLPTRTAMAAGVRIAVVASVSMVLVAMVVIISTVIAVVVPMPIASIISAVVTAVIVGPMAIVIITATVPTRIAAVRPMRVVNNDRRPVIRMVVRVENSEAEERNNRHVRIKRYHRIRPVNVNRGVVVNDFGLLANNHPRLRLDDDRLRFAFNLVRLVVIGRRGDRVIAGYMRWRHGVATRSVPNQHD